MYLSESFISYFSIWNITKTLSRKLIYLYRTYIALYKFDKCDLKKTFLLKCETVTNTLLNLYLGKINLYKSSFGPYILFFFAFLTSHTPSNVKNVVRATSSSPEGRLKWKMAVQNGTSFVKKKREPHEMITPNNKWGYCPLWASLHSYTLKNQP